MTRTGETEKTSHTCEGFAATVQTDMNRIYGVKEKIPRDLDRIEHEMLSPFAETYTAYARLDDKDYEAEAIEDRKVLAYQSVMTIYT